jgi:FkbM family methyltransferase
MWLYVLWDYFKYLIRGLPKPPDHDFNFLHPNMLVFDVGANLGNYANLFRQQGARVIAIEPQPFCYRFLNLRFLFIPLVRVIPVGAGSKQGTIAMTTSTAHTLSSMNPDWIQKVNESNRFHGSQAKWNKTINVPVVTLDSLIEKYGKPDYIKIDVEGFEAQVLQGLSQPLSSISFEYTLPELKVDCIQCIERLQSLGNYNFKSIASGSDVRVTAQELKQEIEVLCKDEKLHNGDIFAFLEM